MRARLLVTEALRSITANVSTAVAATMTVLIGMFLLGLLVALGSWVVSWSDHVKNELAVKAYLNDDATQQQINAVRVKLESDDRVKSVTFISKEQALEEMERKYPELTENLSSNPLPASFLVDPRRAEDTRAIAETLQPLPPGVDKVNYGEKTANRILRVARVIEVIFLVAVLVLLAASTLLIANTIRLSIFARRREIEVMKLVGATNWFVRGPFMLEGLLTGLIGAVAAVVLLLLGKELALPAILGRIDAGSDVKAIAFFWNALILVVVGLLVGAVGSGLTLRKFLRI
ncbi:MAG: permease-like cell division protein FtsX [Actinomycetota bacterium]|nr:permease-like cell division protein FtsX [Actinomycetota bacterium]